MLHLFLPLVAGAVGVLGGGGMVLAAFQRLVLSKPLPGCESREIPEEMVHRSQIIKNREDWKG